MITTPINFLGIHQEEILSEDKKQSLNENFYKKLALNNNWLIDLRPVGSIVFIDVNKFGVGVPNPAIWQECNGSEILNPNSPLRTIGILKNYTPDLRDRYLKVSPDDSNPKAGSQDHALQHSHAMGGASDIGPGLDKKGDRRVRVPHAHAVAEQYEEVTTISSPAFYKCIAYMKVV